MALSQSVVSELLDAFRAGEGVDLVRDAVRLVMQELIETEATEEIGAGRYERTDTRITERNGSRPRLVATQAGDIELRIPKLRKGSFFPSILEPRRRIDQALYAVVMEAYVMKLAFPEVPLIASGGVDQQNAGEFILAGAVALGIGRHLIHPDAIKRRERGWIQELSRRYLATVSHARSELQPVRKDSKV